MTRSPPHPRRRACTVASGQLLSWHRREDKSFWWLYFHLRNDLTDEDRVDASEPIGMLEYEGVVEAVNRSNVHRYRFPPQEHDIRVGSGVRDPATDASPAKSSPSTTAPAP